MAFTDTKLSYFHSFSKMPAQDSTSLGNAINKSGHTVTASEVWAQDIPYYGKMGSIEDVKSKVQPYARKNDMCYITAGADKGKTFQYDGNDTWTDITATLVDGALIKNSKDEVVLLYHKGQNLTNLTADNNANTDSANNAARLWASRAKDGTSLPVGETRLIEQFVAPTDKALNGLASVAYAPVIANGSLVSGTGYYDYCFSGTILWATARTAVTPIDCFEYVGGKVSDVADTVASHASTIATHTSEISELKEKLGIEDDDTPGSDSTPTLGGRVTALEEAVEILNGDATTDGSIAKSIKDAIDGLGDVAIKSDIDNAISDATLGDGEKIATTTDTSKLVTVEDVTTYVSENAKVTLTQGTGITVTPNGEASTEFTIAVNDTVATKQSVDDLSDVVSGVAQTVTDIQTSLSTGSIATAIQTAQDAADAAQDTADEALGLAETAIQKVTVNGTESSGTEVSITALTAVDSNSTGSNGITIGETDKKVTLSVTPATYTSSSKTWGNDTNFAKASDIATAISDAVNAITIPDVTTSTAAQTVGVTASGHEVSVATATYTPAVGETAASWTNQGYLVTGSTVETFVGAETTKTLEAAKAYSDSLHSTNLVYVVLGDSESLPTASAETLGKIYLVASKNAPTADGSAISGAYVEYMTRQVSETEYTWEKIGTTAADLTGYAKSVTINGETYNVTANTVALGDSFVNKVAAAQATALANQGSVYANIATDGTLTLGVASATETVMGVSKMFTGSLSTTSSETDATDTAVSVKSAQAMYSSLANGKVSSVTAGDGDALTGLSVSVGGTTTAPTISVTNGVINSGSLPATAKVVANGLIDGADVIETEKINFGDNLDALNNFI